MPSQLKSRDELPWLYYPRSNSVRVISSHNFPSGGGSLAVNGKSPVAAWVPSLDTAGNGTTTLTDLIGSNNGTLTNMDTATDWVADTGAGGVRALDFDGTNDFVNFGSGSELDNLLSGDLTLSLWAKSSSTGNNQTLFSSSSPGSGFFLRRNDSSSVNSLGVTAYFSTTNLEFTSSSGSFITNTWTHCVVVISASTKTAKIFLNGAEEAGYAESVTGVGTPISDAVGNKELARLGSSGQLFVGRIDDVRIFNLALNSSDVSYLYNSGSGRGRTS